jgi:riboflavin kinase/FMN adenylyltransferase
MQIHKDIADIPAFEHSVMTIGTFDGVHRGHAEIIHQLVENAHATGAPSVVITFYPHPRQVIAQNASIGILTTQEEKYARLDKLGVDHLVEIPFDKNFSEQTAEDYIRNFLYKNFKPSIIITGYDHRFGKNRTGDYALLEKFGKQLGYSVKEIPAAVLEQVAISSTKIREALLNGVIKKANEFLGYAYSLYGTVTQGNQMGRTIGFPTANLLPDEKDKLIPANGVYAVWVEIGAEKFKGMMNIGYRPTVDGKNRTIEVHILDFNASIYGERVRLSFIEKIRDEQKFESLDALKTQLHKDKASTYALLA